MSLLPAILSANDLREGHVVYLTAAGGWTQRLAEAAVAFDDAAAAALLAQAEAQPGTVVGPALAAVRVEAAGPAPLHYREIFRTRGPSNRTDLGRQAEGL